MVTSFGFLAKWHLVEIILGVSMAHRHVVCIEGGKSWGYTNWIGSVFFILHVVGSSMAAGMIRAVFIKTPKASGWFLDDSDLLEVEDVVKKTQ